jgi:parallel beta-helix repeat protein
VNRKLFLSLIGSSFFVSLFPVFSKESRRSSKEIVLYVSPKGNDKWSGNIPNTNGKDGPFATITKARDKIRELKQQQNGQLHQPVKVYLRGGTYFLSKTIEFSSIDSGSQEAPITYQSYRDEKPVFSGGIVLRNWKKVKISDRTIWTATISEVSQIKTFHQLWVDGKRAQRCRYPKKGYLKIDKSLDGTDNWMVGQGRFQYRAGDLQQWKDLDRGEIIIMSRWLETRQLISEIDPKNRVVSFAEPTPIRLDDGESTSSAAGNYYIENLPELLTEPGQWYLDNKVGVIHYLPLKGQTIENTVIIMPFLSKLVNFSGSTEKKEFVEYLHFREITFSHSEWYYSPKIAGTTRRVDYSGLQAAVSVPATITMKGTNFCTWDKCEVSHISSYGMEFLDDSNSNQVVGCSFHDLGAGAIKIGSTTTSSIGKNKISNCHIYNGGNIFHSAVGIWIGKSHENFISGNHIHDFYYSGISVGWTWQYIKVPDAGKNLIQNNHIHHIGKKSGESEAILNDKGGIYTLGEQPGTVISGNLIHNIYSYNYVACGIYLDASSSNIIVENNVVYNVRGYGFHLHYGRDNLIRKNIFALNSLSQLLFSAGDRDHQSFSLDGNIIYWKEGELFIAPWQDIKFKMSNNIYWKVDGKQVKIGKYSWEQWKDKKLDINSKIINPLFISPSSGDFRTKRNSPVLGTGFKNSYLQ